MVEPNSPFVPGLVDLFGDPVPLSRGKRGQPPHVPTAENRRFVQLSLACEASEDDIAAALRISTKTLNRHYFHELRGKRSARLRLEMKTMASMVAQVEGGNVAAMALLDKKLERIKLGVRAAQLQSPSPSPKVPALGKKAQAKADAGKIAGRYAPPPPPLLTH